MTNKQVRRASRQAALTDWMEWLWRKSSGVSAGVNSVSIKMQKQQKHQDHTCSGRCWAQQGHTGSSTVRSGQHKEQTWWVSQHWAPSPKQKDAPSRDNRPGKKVVPPHWDRPGNEKRNKNHLIRFMMLLALRNGQVFRNNWGFNSNDGNYTKPKIAHRLTLVIKPLVEH